MAVMVLVTEDVTIPSPDEARIIEQIAPGIRKIDLAIDPAFDSGISFIVEMISISIEE